MGSACSLPSALWSLSWRSPGMWEDPCPPNWQVSLGKILCLPLPPFLIHHFECILPLGCCFSFPFNLFSFGKAFFNSFIYTFCSRRHRWAQAYPTHTWYGQCQLGHLPLTTLYRLLAIDYWMPSCPESRDSTGKDSV